MSQKRVKMVAWLVCLALIITTVCVPNIRVFAAPAGSSGSCGSSITWTFDSETGVLTLSGKGAMYGMLPGDKYAPIPWEAYMDDITQVEIANGITNIAEYAFYGADNLTLVDIPKSVKTIGIDTFGKCTNLEYLVIPDTVTTIGNAAFEGLDEVYYSGTATCSGEDFWGANKIVTDFFPAGGNLVAILKDGVLTFEGRGEFNVTSYGYNMQPWIKVVSEIEEVKFLSDIKELPGNIFGTHRHLKKVTFNSALEYIGNSAFSNTSIFSLDVPDTVTSIGSNAFLGVCNVNYHGSAKEMTVGDWGANAINGYVDGDFVYKDSTKEYLAGGKKDVDTITIPDTVRVIGKNAFMFDQQLQSVVLPDHVEEIEEKAFCNCTNLKEVKLSQNLTNIAAYAFDHCVKLNNIDLPNNVVSIGDYGFNACEALTNIHLNSGLKSIGECAFAATEMICAPLLYVPCSVETIGNDAFNSVSTLAFSGKASGAPWGARKYISNETKEGHVDTEEDGICDVCGCNINEASRGIELTYSENVSPTASLNSIVPVLNDKYEYVISIFQEDTNQNGNFFDDMMIVATDEMLESYARGTGVSKETLLVMYEQNGITVKDSITPGLNYSFVSLISLKGEEPFGKQDEPLPVRLFFNDKEIRDVTLDVNGWIDTSKLNLIIHANKNVTVNYEANGGSGTMEEQVVTLDSNNREDFVFPACTIKAPAKKMFAGWKYYTKSKPFQILEAAEGDICEIVEDMTVYPVWKDHAPHVYADDWKYDERNHWKECECGEIAEVATHTFDEGMVTKEATETTEGVKTYTCTVCGKTKTESIPKKEAEKPTPTALPEKTPEIISTAAPEKTPEIIPTAAPEKTPEIIPTATPEKTPEIIPTAAPEKTPEIISTAAPEKTPEIISTAAPEKTPEIISTAAPEKTPEIISTAAPEKTPEIIPTVAPGETPGIIPIASPSGTPDVMPTNAPSGILGPISTVNPSGTLEDETTEEPKMGDVVFDDKTGAQVKVVDLEKKEVSYVSPKSKKSTTIIVPGSVVVNGVTYKVTKIDDKAFKGNKIVTKIVLPSSIKIIGKDAFNGCIKLKSITIAKSVVKIGANAFKGCKSLKSINVKTVKLTSKKVSKNAFLGTPKKAVMKVPKKQLKNYKKFMKKKGFKGKIK